MDSFNKWVYHRNPLVMTPATLETVATAFINTPSLSIRRAQQLDVLYSSLQRVTHILKLIPYKVSVIHELKPGDPAERVNFCHWFQKFIARQIDVLDTTFFSDEAWFYLSGYVNTQNTVTGHSQIQTKKLKHHYEAKRLKSGVPFPQEEL